MANQDDDLYQAAERQFKSLSAARKRSEAMLAEYRADNNLEGIGEALQEIGNIDAAASNLSNLARRHAQSQQAPPQVPQTAEEWRTKAVERMTPEDGLLVARKSKYGADLDWNDPNVRRGWEEMQRRRGRGE